MRDHVERQPGMLKYLNASGALDILRAVLAVLRFAAWRLNQSARFVVAQHPDAHPAFPGCLADFHDVTRLTLTVLSEFTLSRPEQNPGEIMFKLITCVRRLPHLSVDEFDRHWREQHAPLIQAESKTLKIRRYI